MVTHASTAKDLGFGRYFTDRMFVMDWTPDGGWHGGRVAPRAELALDPAAAVLHYGQAMFEGLKAMRGPNGRAQLFRVDRHAARMAAGAERLCVPVVPPAAFEQAVIELVRAEQAAIPREPDASLYIRPTLVATEAFLGVRPAQAYAFFVICSPVGPYFAEGARPLKIWVERDEVRAVRGGLGAVKTGANYAASLHAAALAKARGYAQVLWLDGVERKYLEEVGTMNVFVRVRDEVVTPPLDGTILAGVTRDAVITLLRGWGIKVSERKISIDEVVAAHAAGDLDEAFGTGTAAVIAPIGELGVDGRALTVAGGGVGPLSARLLDEIAGIQRGTRPDPHGWVRPV
jgi:branched-chain amino acid aminotransferase